MTLPSIGWLCETFNAPLPSLDLDELLGSICIDTRKLESGNTFWAIDAARDGHEFVEEAFRLGARVAVVNSDWSRDKRELPFADRLIRVDSTRRALTEAGSKWRSLLSCPRLAITGSNGKTSTKDLIIRLVSRKFRTVGTQGNLNNDLGVPLTLLNIPLSTEFAVIELGANHPHEIGELCKVCDPTLALVTSIGKAHLEGFGNLEALAETKGEVYDYVANSGQAFVPTDDEMCVDQSREVRSRIGYGFGEVPRNWSSEFHRGDGLSLDRTGCAQFRFDGCEFTLGIPGRPAAISALSALTVACHFGIAADQCQETIREWRGVGGRAQVVRVGGLTLIDDSYNANPASMRAALELLSSIPSTRRVAILGDMNELGSYAEAEHAQLGVEVAKFGIDLSIFVGEFSRAAHEAAKKESITSEYFDTYDLLEAAVDKLVLPNDTVLVKASRGMKLERVVQHLKSRFS